MSAEVTLTYRLSPELFRAAVMASSTQGRSALAQPVERLNLQAHLLYAALTVVSTLALITLFSLIRPPVSFAYFTMGVGFGILVTFALWQHMHRRDLARYAARNARLEAVRGEITARFSQAGISLASGIGQSEIRRPAVQGVAPVTGGSAVFLGADVLAFPDEALPAGLTPEAFRTQLADWSRQ